MLSYTPGIRIYRLLGLRNYLDNYFAMYKRLPRSFIQVEHATPRLLGVKNYLNNYFAMYKRLTLSCIRVELASPAYLGLAIISIIILPCIRV